MTTVLPHDPSATDCDLLIGLDFCDGRMTLAGELDALTAPRLTEAAQVLRSMGCRDLVVDLGKVSFICAAGFNALARVAVDLEAEGHQLHLVNVPPRLVRYFAAGSASWLLPH